MAHLIPLPSKVSATRIAKILLKGICITHRKLTDIVSNGHTKITLYFWQILMDLLGIKTKLSTALHSFLENDRQSDRVNQSIKQYLHH